MQAQGPPEIENVFGISSSVFRVVRKPIILSEPEKVEVVVIAVAHLHNFLRKMNSVNIYTLSGKFDREKLVDRDK